MAQSRFLALAFALAACGSNDVKAPAQPSAPSSVAAKPAAALPAPPAIPSASASTSASAPPPALAASETITGEVDVLWSGPAWDGLVLAGTAWIIEQDFVTLAGYDARTGKQVFREKMLEKPLGGRHTLSERNGKLMFWAGPRLFLLDPETGAHGPALEVPSNGQCQLSEEGTACAFACECSLSIVDCATLKPKKDAHFNKTYTEFFPPDEEPSAGCYGRGTALIGGNERVIVVVVEDETKQSRGMIGKPLVIRGLDAKTGARLYQKPGPLALGGEAGFTPDQKSFYFVDASNVITMYDAATGNKRWSSKAEPDPDRVNRKLFAWLKNPDSIFRFAEDEAFLHDPQTGKPRFRVRVPKNAVVVPKGYLPTFGDIESPRDSALEMRILDPSNGAAVGTVQLPANTTVYGDPAGGYYALNQFLTAYDETGKERAKAPADPPNLHVFSDFVTLFSGERLAALSREGLTKIFEAEGSLVAQPGSSAAEGILLHAFRDRGKKVGLARLLRRKITPRQTP